MSADHLSYNVRFWRIETRADPSVRYRVRWTVDGRRFGRPFVSIELAESFRAQLKAAASKGEGFDTETGLPQSLLRQHRDVSCLAHCHEFVAAVWKNAAAKSRISILETLTVVVIGGTPGGRLFPRRCRSTKGTSSWCGSTGLVSQTHPERTSLWARVIAV